MRRWLVVLGALSVLGGLVIYLQPLLASWVERAERRWWATPPPQRCPPRSTHDPKPMTVEQFRQIYAREIAKNRSARAVMARRR